MRRNNVCPFLGILIFALLVLLAPGRAVAAFHPLTLPAPAGVVSAESPAADQSFPEGRQTFGGVPFQIGELRSVTGVDAARRGVFHPVRTPLIPVQRRVAQVHLLLAIDGVEKDGVPLATVNFHYAGGQLETVRIAHGVHVRGAATGNRDRRMSLADPASKLVWSGPDAEGEKLSTRLALFHVVLTSPKPEAVLEHVELISLFAQPTLSLVAVSVADESVEPILEAPERRRVRQAAELPDSAYRAEFLLQVKDSGSGESLTNALASLTIREAEGAFFFGEAASGLDGAIRLPFPPQQLTGFDIVVRAPGHVPTVISRSSPEVGGVVERQREVRMARGVRVGGLVQSESGKPVSGATLVLHRVTRENAREFTRLDFDTVQSGPDGRWATECVPTGVEGLLIEASHPEHRGRVFTQAEVASDAAGQIAMSELLANRVPLKLPDALRLKGLVASATGKPLEGLELTWMEADRSVPPGRVLRCDHEGRFTLLLQQPSGVILMARAKGHRPKLLNVSVEESTADVSLKLTLASPLQGTVVDQHQKPVPGARVRVESWAGTKILDWQAITDGEGAFIWDAPPEGTVMFQISATNYNSTRHSVNNPGRAQRFTLRRQSRILGRVVDADTKKPIDDFALVRGRTYNEDEPMRWERYDTTRGRRGEYSLRLNEYGSNGRQQILVEANGYMPAVSTVIREPGVYTNDFALRKSRGLHGIVQLADGTPVTNALVVLVERSDDVMMDKGGELRRNGYGGDFQRTNRRGEFEFAPRLEPHTVFASHALGFAEVRASNVVATGRVVLEPWARIEGRFAVSKATPGGQTVSLRSMDWNYGQEGRSGPPLYLEMKAETDAAGNFAFDKVPPGDRKVAWQLKINDRNYGRGMSQSHGTPLEVKPGKTATVTLGGSGRTVLGRMTVTGAAPEDIDWLRDVHTLTRDVSLPPDIRGPDYKPNMSQEEQRRTQREYNERLWAYWSTPEGRAQRRQQRNYTLLFETNGTFRVENVEPGNYYLYVSLTNPDRPDNYYDQIGSMNHSFTVPTAGGKPNDVVDVGELKIQVRGLQRTGRPAPPFELKALDGKTIRLADFRGKHVLLDFWAGWAGSRQVEARALKTAHDTYAKDGRLVIIGLNFDPDRATAENLVKENGFTWPQCHAGPWGNDTLATTYGIQGLPDNVLIDPQGRVVARNLRGTSLASRLRDVLGGTKRAP